MLALRLALAALSLTIEGVSASPLQNEHAYALKDAHPVPKAYSRVGPAPAGQILNVEIGLKQARFDELERQLYDVSDPDSANYAKHLTIDQVNQLVAPSDKSVSAVEDWLASNGVSKSQLSYSPAKDWVQVSLPVSKVESLLNTKYSVYQHQDGSKLVRTSQYSLPKSLHDDVELVVPTNSFVTGKRAKSSLTSRSLEKRHSKSTVWKPNIRKVPVDASTSKIPSAGAVNVSGVCDPDHVTPTCLRTLYGTIDYTPQVPGKNKVALTDYLGESNNRSDTRLFLQKYRPDAVSEADSFQFEVIANGSDSQAFTTQFDIEGNLDVQTLIGIDYPTPLTAFTTGGEASAFKPDAEDPTNENEPYTTWLQRVLNQKDLPQTISNSYADNEQTVPPAFARRVCNGFAQLGARGVSVLFGSGDSGVGGVHESTVADCTSNNGTNATTFLAAFPASCSFVTTVGATKNFNPEVVAINETIQYSSGGGFSNYFARPSYQDDVVPAYIKSLGSQYAGLYNTSGRGYPDVAAQGFDYAIFWEGAEILVDGTSAATPCFSAVVSLVNDALLAAGKPTLGFLNPWLYKKGYKGTTDVTSGSAVGCGVAGFPATKGWDAVTGFGTPIFPQLKALALSANSTK